MSKDVQLNFRLPAELKAKLEAAATAHNRTVSAEAVNRLHDSFNASLDREATDEWLKLVEERDWLKTKLFAAMELVQQSQQTAAEAQAMNQRLLAGRKEPA
jgi:plasmid stability protein